jgi:hypothetical protein
MHYSAGRIIRHCMLLSMIGQIWRWCLEVWISHGPSLSAIDTTQINCTLCIWQLIHHSARKIMKTSILYIVQTCLEVRMSAWHSSLSAISIVLFHICIGLLMVHPTWTHLVIRHLGYICRICSGVESHPNLIPGRTHTSHEKDQCPIFQLYVLACQSQVLFLKWKFAGNKENKQSKESKRSRHMKLRGWKMEVDREQMKQTHEASRMQNGGG